MRAKARKWARGCGRLRIWGEKKYENGIFRFLETVNYCAKKKEGDNLEQFTGREVLQKNFNSKLL